MLLHREAFLQSELYTEKLSRASFYTEAFTQSKLIHTEAFTHRRFYTQKLLRTETFTQRSFYIHRVSFYTEKLSHRESDAQRSFYTQKLLHTEAYYAEQGFTQSKLLHREAFTQRIWYTEKLLRREAFTHRSFYTEQAFTQRSFYRQTVTNTFTQGSFNVHSLASNGSRNCSSNFWGTSQKEFRKELHQRQNGVNSAAKSPSDHRSLDAATPIQSTTLSIEDNSSTHAAAGARNLHAVCRDWVDKHNSLTRRRQKQLLQNRMDLNAKAGKRWFWNAFRKEL